MLEERASTDLSFVPYFPTLFHGWKNPIFGEIFYAFMFKIFQALKFLAVLKSFFLGFSVKRRSYKKKVGHEITTQEEHHIRHSPCHTVLNINYNKTRKLRLKYEIKYDTYKQTLKN